MGTSVLDHAGNRVLHDRFTTPSTPTPASSTPTDPVRLHYYTIAAITDKLPLFLIHSVTK